MSETFLKNTKIVRRALNRWSFYENILAYTTSRTLAFQGGYTLPRLNFIQWNLDITKALYVEVHGITKIFLTPVKVKYMKKNRYNETSL